MKIPLTEPTTTRYIRFNPAANRMHLLVSKDRKLLKSLGTVVGEDKRKMALP